MARRKPRYSGDLPRKMYTFFVNYSDIGAPSFEKFARCEGFTLEELQGFRRRSDFDRAWRECNEIRRDYLIDTALVKRHDSSFTKFLLAFEFGMDEPIPTEDERSLKVTLEVI